ncbi:hypothetical protein [Streptomyces sp. NPDC041003]|uniref:hypothetical protein n=1 Tax=Streptomyces sp. NPDC041003 TaxID=3155730 RepID=UPI0033CA6AD2
MHLQSRCGGCANESAGGGAGCRSRASDAKPPPVTIERFAKDPKDPVEVDDQRDPAPTAELVADAARHVTRQLKCETASRLPAGPPVMGAGASG